MDAILRDGKLKLGSVLADIGAGGSSPNAQKRNQLQTLIDMACDPSLPEPDLALGLEVCDYINTTKKNSPREAAMTLVDYANSRDQHQAMLALSVLDLCAKNCDYPFHLQLANKDFLNELMRKFPEHPPTAKTAVQEKILELLQQWNTSIYEMSKYKSDLGHINDMYRLVQYKGYKFPRVREDAAKVMLASSSMKTRDEMEAEDRAAQSAKLQELLRRATPADLKAANDLMKEMAGFYHDKQPDYEKKEDQELDKVEEKANAALQALRQLQPGESIANNEKVQELLAVVKTAKPKITKCIEDEADGESGRIERLLFLNDLLNEVTTIYEEIKSKGAGNVAIPAERRSSPTPAAPTQTTSAKTSPKQPAAAALIDLGFGDAPSTAAPVVVKSSTPQASGASNVMDLLGDLQDLSFTTPAPTKPTVQPMFPPAIGGMGGMSTMNAGGASMTAGGIRLDSMNAAFWSAQSKQPGVGPSPMFGNMQSPASLVGSSVSPSPSMTVQPAISALSPPSAGSGAPVASFPVGAQSLDKVVFEKNGLKVVMRARLSNDQVMNIQLDPASGLVLPPNSVNSVVQSFKIANPNKAPMKVRFRLTFQYNNLSMTEQGEAVLF